MTPELRDYARLLLSREPTRSLPLGVLRERLRQVAGSRWAGPVQLEQALSTDPSFRLLRPPPLVASPLSGYAAEVLAGFPQPEPRVLLVEPQPQPAADADLFGATGDSLVALLAREGMSGDVAEAIAALEEIGLRLREPAPMPAGAARSTTPLPDPPPPAPVAPAPRPRAWRPPRRPGYR